MIGDSAEAASVGGRAIAAALNARGVRTARGGEWHATTVRNVTQREEAQGDALTPATPSGRVPRPRGFAVT